MTEHRELRIVDLREVLAEPAVHALLSQSPGPVDQLIEEHRANLQTRVALGVAQGVDVRAAVIARTPYAGVCEILAIGVEDPELRGCLVDAAADHLHAVAIWAQAEHRDRQCWEELGFSLRADPQDPQLLRVERRHPPEPEGFRTSAAIHVASSRHMEIDLPPEGNTLPLVPEPLRDRELPAHVARWILDADETGMLLQDLAPDIFPPVTPAVRPPSVRAALGTLGAVLGDPSIDERLASDLLPGLPEGLHVPVRIVEMIAAADRIRAWLLEAQRVRRWADEQGHADAPWIVHDPWEPHADVPPERHGRPAALDTDAEQAP